MSKYVHPPQAGSAKTGVFLFRPKDAQEYHDLYNTNNYRILRPGGIAAIARDIAAGRWDLTHESIAISIKGILLDGQHRLLAIASGKRSVPLRVTVGIPDSVAAVIDCGMPRGAQDHLKNLGYANATVVASIVRRMIQRTRGGATGRMSPVEIAAHAESLTGIEEDASLSVSVRSMCSPAKLILPSMAGFGLQLIREHKGPKPHTQFAQFLLNIAEGTDLKKGSAAIALHRRLTSGLLDHRASMPAIMQLSLILTAFSAHRLGRPLRAIAWKKEPTIIDLPYIDR